MFWFFLYQLNLFLYNGTMRKKVISKTYFRDVSAYQFKLYYDDSKDFVVWAKKIEKVKSPFVTSNGIT